VVAVVPAGERWDTDGSLRPGLEDLWGAGAVLAALEDLGGTGLSVEARAAAAAFRAACPTLAASLAECSSGRELVEAGFREDVAVAAGRERASHAGAARRNVGPAKLTRSPGRTGVAPRIRKPFRRVPLVDRRSSRNQRSPSSMSTA